MAASIIVPMRTNSNSCLRTMLSASVSVDANANAKFSKNPGDAIRSSNILTMALWASCALDYDSKAEWVGSMTSNAQTDATNKLAASARHSLHVKWRGFSA